MIIYIDDYRRAEDMDADALHEPHLAEERLYGNGSAQARLAPFAAYRTRREPTPDLPDDFADVDLREFIERVSSLATQI